jgi:hypothetical protein
MMGLFWDLIQQSQISATQNTAADLQQRITRLELELDRTRRMLHDLVVLLEKHFGQDFNRDGRIAE